MQKFLKIYAEYTDGFLIDHLFHVHIFQIASSMFELQQMTDKYSNIDIRWDAFFSELL